MMIKISSGNAAFDLGFMHELRMQGWTKKQASVMLDYALQFSNGQDMVKAASAGIVPEDPEANPVAFVKWAASARERYAWCNMTKSAGQSPSWGEIGDQFRQAGRSGWDAIQAGTSGIYQGGKKIYQNGKNIMDNYVKPALTSPYSPLAYPMAGVPDLGRYAKQGWDMAKNVPTAIGKGIGYAHNGWDNAKQWASEKWDAAKTGISDAWDATKGYARDAYNKGKDLVNRGVEAGKNVARGVGDFFGGLWNKTKELAGRGVDKVKQWYNDGREAVSQGIDDAKQWGRDTYNAGREAVSQGIEDAKQWGRDKVNQGIETAKQWGRDARDWATGVGRDIRDFAGRQIDKGIAGYNEARGLNKSSSALYNWYFNRY